MNQQPPAIEQWDVVRLTPFAQNARTHSAKQVEQIVASMKEFGWTIPILVAEDGTVIAGHGRLLAAQKLGMGTAPVIVARGWSDEQRRAYVIADNKLATNAGWDEMLLSAEVEFLKLKGFNVALTGFDVNELQSLEGKFKPEPAGEQSHLDIQATITCPHCGASFER